MRDIKIDFIDNDQAVRAKTEIASGGQNVQIINFLQQIREELSPGDTAYLEIEGLEKNPITLEISICNDSLIHETTGRAI
jgi:hypothetical protein